MRGDPRPNIFENLPDAHALKSLIDAMEDGVAIVSRDGTILCVNRVWRQFSDENGGDQTTHYIGHNHLRVHAEGNGEDDELAKCIEIGLSNVLTEGKTFRAEYPCHSPTEQRWFEVVASPVELRGEHFALIVHRNITSRVVARIEATHAEQNTQNLAAIVATMRDAVIAFDLEGRITSWNDAARKLYGYRREEVVGLSMEILYPPVWPKKVKDYIAEIVANDLGHFDVVRRTKAGALRTIAVTAAPIRSSSGEIVGISNVHRDVTEERQSEQRLRNVLNNLFAFVGILEPDGTLVDANQAPLDVAGLEAKDVIGKKFWDCHWWSYDPDVQEQLMAACERARGGDVVRYDVRVRIAGEQLIWIDFQLAPMNDSNGQVINLIPSGIDISDRKAMVDALKTSHDTFKNWVAGSPFGIYTVDADFRLAHVSLGAQQVFANVHPVVGHDFADALRIIWPEPFASEAIARFRHTLSTGETYRSSSTIERRNDRDDVEAYDWMIERITMPDGRRGVVCNFYDLSERQRYEEHIKLLMREVNHRAKNLLAVVMAVARQTVRGCPPAEFVDRFSQRLIGLSSSQDLIVQGNWGGVSVADLVRSQIKHLGEDVRSNRVRIEGPDITLTPAAAQGIGMALHELSTNALKYGSLSLPSGTVTINWSAAVDDDTFSIEWCELDCPPVSPPQGSGFGRTVIERMAAMSVNGTVDLSYAQSGLRWTLTAPLTGVEGSNDSVVNLEIGNA